MSEKYFLISKLTKVPFVKYKGNAVVLSEKLPMTYDEVVVGLKDKTTNKIFVQLRLLEMKQGKLLNAHLIIMVNN